MLPDEVAVQDFILLKLGYAAYTPTPHQSLRDSFPLRGSLRSAAYYSECRLQQRLCPIG